MDGVTFQKRQEGLGSREWDPVFSKIKDIPSSLSRSREKGLSEDTNT